MWGARCHEYFPAHMTDLLQLADTLTNIPCLLHPAEDNNEIVAQ